MPPNTSVQKNNIYHYRYIETIFCNLILIAHNNYLTEIFLFKKKDIDEGKIFTKSFSKIINKTIYELEKYFSGKLKKFTPLTLPKGTDFQKKVWRALQDIPYGNNVSYGEIAKTIHNPKAYRAVGMANKHNPIPIIIPCHRVISSNGDIGGYRPGIPYKIKLLNHEKKHI